MSQGLGASDEDLIPKSEEEHAKKTSFFDNTIDESENESVEGSKEKEMEVNKEMAADKADQSGKDKNVLMKESKSFMEIESTREKRRWLYMSELGAIFGEEKHTREGFMKIFGTRVSELCEKSFKIIIQP